MTHPACFWTLCNCSNMSTLSRFSCGSFAELHRLCWVFWAAWFVWSFGQLLLVVISPRVLQVSILVHAVDVVVIRLRRRKTKKLWIVDMLQCNLMLKALVGAFNPLRGKVFIIFLLTFWRLKCKISSAFLLDCGFFLGRLHFYIEDFSAAVQMHLLVVHTMHHRFQLKLWQKLSQIWF